MVSSVGRKGAERVSVKLEVVSGVVAANLIKGVLPSWRSRRR